MARINSKPIYQIIELLSQGGNDSEKTLSFGKWNVECVYIVQKIMKIRNIAKGFNTCEVVS